MSNGLTRAIEKLIENFVEENKLQKPFYKAGAVPPLKILSISNALPALNLANEEILFCYDRRAYDVFKGFVLTDKNFHFVTEKPMVVPVGELSMIDAEITAQVLGDDYKALAQPLNELLHDIADGNFDKKSNKTAAKSEAKEIKRN